MQHELAALKHGGAWTAQLTGKNIDAALRLSERRLVANGGGQDLSVVAAGVRNYLALNESGSGYIVGERLSMGDLHAFNVLTNWYVSSPNAL